MRSRVFGRNGQTVGKLAYEAVAGFVVKGIEGDDMVSQTFQGPEAIEGGIVRGEAGSVQNLHAILRFL
jgi:hypothetical protein